MTDDNNISEEEKVIHNFHFILQNLKEVFLVIYFQNLR
jgi:hypothetical protein